MPTIAEVRQQISKARTSLESQKSQIKDRKQEAEKAGLQLEKQKQSLPSLSQSRLRSGLYGGLEGRKRRQIVSKIKSDIGTKQKEVESYKGELYKYEKGALKKREIEIGKVEGEVREYEIQKEELKMIKNIVDKGGLGASNLNPRQKKIYENLLYNEQLGYSSPTSNIVEPPSIDKIKVSDFSTGTYYVVSQTYIDPSGQGMSIRQEDIPTGANIVFGKDPYLSKLSNIKMPSPRGLSRIDTVKDFSKLNNKKINNLLLETKKTLEKPMRTTGSPIRMTKLSSLKSKGYIKDRKQTKRIIGKKIRKKSTKKLKKNKDFGKSLLFKDKFSKEESNFWGI